MSDTEYLQRRINATEDLHKVVKMMKSLALANVRRNELAVEAMAVQSRAVKLGLRAFLRRHPLPSPRQHGPQRIGLLLLGSDQGMCGPFNERIGEYSVALIDEIKKEAKLDVIAIGTRLTDILIERGHPANESVSSAVTVDAARLLVRKLIPTIEAWNSSGFSRVLIAHNRPLGGSAWRPVTVDLLPLSTEWVTRISAESWPSRTIPSWNLDDDALFAHLVREHLVLTTFRAAVDSLSAENASRLAAMQAAERSIGERLDDLHLSLQQERQTAITLELLELVAGFEALSARD